MLREQSVNEPLRRAQDEDTRNFFASHRQHQRLPSLHGDNLAIPILADPIPATPTTAGLANSDIPQTPPRQPTHLGFEMATPQKEGAETRIIYTSDSDLAAMLESLARGTDSAKFEIRRPEQYHQDMLDAEARGEPLPTAPISAGYDDASRLRVEAEIYSLLAANDRGETAGQAPPSI